MSFPSVKVGKVGAFTKKSSPRGYPPGERPIPDPSSTSQATTWPGRTRTFAEEISQLAQPSAVTVSVSADARTVNVGTPPIVDKRRKAVGAGMKG